MSVAWRAAHNEWGPGLHEDGFGIVLTDDVDSPAGFDAWVDALNAERERCTFRWIVEDGRVLGGIALRHATDEWVSRIGHIGFGITPSARRRGLASWALGEMLSIARALGMRRVLLVCEADNAASARTIERLGGVLEHTGEDAERRYWVELEDGLPCAQLAP